MSTTLDRMLRDILADAPHFHESDGTTYWQDMLDDGKTYEIGYDLDLQPQA